MRLRKNQSKYKIRGATGIVRVLVKVNGYFNILCPVNKKDIECANNYNGGVPFIYYFDPCDQVLEIYPPPKKCFYATVRFLQENTK